MLPHGSESHKSPAAIPADPAGLYQWVFQQTKS
jgi:hypothetical protein